MHTRCPECQTLFKVDGSQLAQANGYVKCCNCDAVFNALDHEADPIEDASSILADEHDSSEFDWLSTEFVDEQALKNKAPKVDSQVSNAQLDSFLNDDSSSVSPQIEEYDELLSSIDDIKPSDGDALSIEDVLESKKSHLLSGFMWAIIVLLLTTSFIFQVIWQNRNEAVHYNESRWVLEEFCAIANCTVPHQKAPEKINIINSEVILNNDAFLAIHLIVNNQSEFSQPFPLLEVTLLNTEEQVVAKRTFEPRQYITRYQPDALFEPGQIQHIQLDLVDPGESAAGYRFTFL